MISFNNLLDIFCGMITARYSDECLTALFVAGVKSSLPERIVLIRISKLIPWLDKKCGFSVSSFTIGILVKVRRVIFLFSNELI